MRAAAGKSRMGFKLWLLSSRRLRKGMFPIMVVLAGMGRVRLGARGNWWMAIGGPGNTSTLDGRGVGFGDVMLFEWVTMEDLIVAKGIGRITVSLTFIYSLDTLVLHMLFLPKSCLH
jgi:hypothetical protein